MHNEDLRKLINKMDVIEGDVSQDLDQRVPTNTQGQQDARADRLRNRPDGEYMSMRGKNYSTNQTEDAEIAEEEADEPRGFPLQTKLNSPKEAFDAAEDIMMYFDNLINGSPSRMRPAARSAHQLAYDLSKLIKQAWPSVQRDPAAQQSARRNGMNPNPPDPKQWVSDKRSGEWK